jgi:rhodanese-related sulfurtransferase
VKDETQKALQWLLILLVLSTILGFGSNAFRQPTLPLFKPLPSLFDGEISVQDARRVSQGREGVFWDVRSEVAFNRKHIPRALSIEQVPPPEQKVIVYCGGRRCPKAQQAANELRESGYDDVWVMPDGMEGWISAGYPLRGSSR